MECEHYSEATREIIQSVFNDLTYKYFREFRSAKFQPPDHNPDHPYSATTAQLVDHIGVFLRPSFKELFPSIQQQCQDRDEFVEHVLSICDAFLRGEFHCMSKAMGAENINFIMFLLAFSFLSELMHTLMGENCYRYLKTLQKCMMIVYDRWLKGPLEALGGLRGLVQFCEHMYPFYDNIIWRTENRLLGQHELSAEVKEIKQRIVDCSREYNRLRIVLSVEERQLIAEDKENPDKKTTSCDICRSNCKYYLMSLVCPIEIPENTGACCEDDSD